ncbi:MAG: class I SAM-dependent RNA methyltransferase [Bacilli bacterium]|nr:class I SAM-dependent RNA methyltransferase [Bacilli bacterium]
MVVKVLRLNNEGEGIASIDGKLVFIKGALPNEEVDIDIIEDKGNYYIGKLNNIITSSSDRVIPKCPYYDKCGGCFLMHLSYNKQLEFKQDKVKGVFKKICDIDINPVIYSFNELNYRNKVTLKVNGNSIGYYEEKSHSIVDIDTCLLLDNSINEVITKLRNFIQNKNHNISEIMIRSISNEIMISFDNMNSIYKEELLNIFPSCSIYIKDECISGKKSLIETIENYKFYVSPNSFFQVNSLTFRELYKYVISNLNGNGNALDLYSGTGTISILMSKHFNKVYGIEVSNSSIRDANENIKLNNISNVYFIEGKVEDKIDELKELDINTIIMDPPRSGSDNKSLKSIMEIDPRSIIYISCNPVTLARDINMLKDKYEIKSINLFDMFPQTSHVETVCILERKN